MLETEENFDVRVLKFLVYVRQVVLNKLLLKLDMMVFRNRPLDTLIPNSDTVEGSSFCAELADESDEDCVSVPINHRCQVDVHVKVERECVLFKVAIR